MKYKRILLKLKAGALLGDKDFGFEKESLENIELENISKNYPDITIVSVTQKIDPIKNYDQIILIMEWEILAMGKHDELMSKVPEYVQIYNSQLSTNNYELQAE